VGIKAVRARYQLRTSQTTEDKMPDKKQDLIDQSLQDLNTLQQGELTNKSYVVAVLTLTCLLGFGVKAHAQGAKVSVTVPFEFVAGGQILPAASTSLAVTPPTHIQA
jgi:hypothetical protein